MFILFLGSVAVLIAIGVDAHQQDRRNARLYYRPKKQKTISKRAAEWLIALNPHLHRDKDVQRSERSWELWTEKRKKDFKRNEH